MVPLGQTAKQASVVSQMILGSVRPAGGDTQPGLGIFRKLHLGRTRPCRKEASALSFAFQLSSDFPVSQHSLSQEKSALALPNPKPLSGASFEGAHYTVPRGRALSHLLLE